MPRWASRITLEVTEVRVQRLQAISEEDAVAEGLTPGRRDEQARQLSWGRLGFMELWESINGKRAPWSSNPSVWAISFRRVRDDEGGKA